MWLGMWRVGMCAMILCSAVWGAKIAPIDFKVYDMPTQDSQGPSVLIMSGIQGDEPGAYNATNLLLQYYTIKKGNVRVIPVLSPHSMFYNNRGVYGDLNRKFAALSEQDPEYHTIQKIKEQILRPDVQAIFHMHDGSGFYREKHISEMLSPKRWGNCSIIDQDSIDVSPYGLDSEVFMRECTLESQFITSWLGQEDRALSQILMPCAMLLRLGIIVFSASLKQLGKDREFLEKIKANDFKNIALVEMEYFRVDSFSFLTYLFHHWEFDESLILMMEYCVKPYAATPELKKGAYALAVVNTLFGMRTNHKKEVIEHCVEILQDARAHGVNFSVDNFLRNAQNVKF